ncbi:TetR family transcriptional regulator [Pullulanibacillus sp. KACC 23026]|uniref:TetR family transcriptional regulator n=1 Tax=Pullulanibacillus sp. KACC 23026 TaxID=3028315 RepID=UPI0023AFA28B|nr:TetR family transcriptional regulator [Pullulanibacillus sp. KACC 23026]WEG11779.1 TetR family transcriptional regulator [Pullulanibacillus sp. KACC 23026]
MPKVSPEHFKKRRAEILEAAKKVFTKKGFEPTTMQDVVKESGMSRGGVYQYFSSPEEMFIAIREDGFEAFDNYLRELLDTHETVWDALLAYVNNYIYEPESEGISFGLVSYEYSVVSWRNEQHRQVILNQALKATETFKDFLQVGVDRGEFTPLYSLEAIALFIFNVTDGLLLHAVFASESANHLYINEQVASLILYLRTALQIRE